MDDFEIVDNYNKFEQVEYEEDDFKIGDGDELEAMSNLNKEIKEVQELKKQLKSQCIESTKLIKILKEQNTKNNELESRLKNELKQLNKEKQEFTDHKLELKRLLDSMASVPSNVQKSSELIAKLNKFYTDTSSVEAELEKLKALRVTQQDMINQCKINIETMNSKQVKILL